LVRRNGKSLTAKLMKAMQTFPHAASNIDNSNMSSSNSNSSNNVRQLGDGWSLDGWDMDLDMDMALSSSYLSTATKNPLRGSQSICAAAAAAATAATAAAKSANSLNNLSKIK